MPERRLDTAADRTTPKTMPSAVEMMRSTTNFSSGAVIEALPLSTTPANASASTAPVGSLSADSAMIVCETFGRNRSRSNSGIRIAGSVGANAAPINKPEESGRPKALAATPPVIPAVRITPGTTSMSSPTTTPPRTRVESCRPPWKRMKETPIVSSSCGPMESSGTSIAPETDGPRSAPAKRRTSMRGARR